MTWGGEGGFGAVFDMRNFFPFGDESAYAVPWGYWYNGKRDATAEEPPADIKKMMDTYDNKVKTAPTVEGQNKAMAEIMQMSADYFPAIGISTPAPGYGIAKNGMDNVPAKMLNSWQYPTPAPVNTFTFFFK